MDEDTPDDGGNERADGEPSEDVALDPWG